MLAPSPHALGWTSGLRGGGRESLGGHRWSSAWLLFLSYKRGTNTGTVALAQDTGPTAACHVGA